MKCLAQNSPRGVRKLLVARAPLDLTPKEQEVRKVGRATCVFGWQIEKIHPRPFHQQISISDSTAIVKSGIPSPSRVALCEL